MKFINKMTIVASISIASMSAVAIQDSIDNSALKLEEQNKQKQELLLDAKDVKPTDLYVCPKCRPHGEVPHDMNWLERLKDLFGSETSIGQLADTQSIKSSDDDFA